MPLYIRSYKDDITCRWSWKAGKNIFLSYHKNLVWIVRNLKYLIFLSSFCFFIIFRQDSFDLELQTRFFLKEKKKILVWTLNISWISYDSCLILLFLINQTRFLSSWNSDKILFTFLSKRILPEYRNLSESKEKQEPGKNRARSPISVRTSVALSTLLLATRLYATYSLSVLSRTSFWFYYSILISLQWN